MLLIAGALQACHDDPMVELVVVNDIGLPSGREPIPEKTQNVRDDDGQQCHLEDLHDSADFAVVGDFVISVGVAVAPLLEEVKDLLLRDEVAGTQAGDSEHFEEQKVAKDLLFSISLTGQNKEPRDIGQGMENEAAIQNVPRGNKLQTVDRVVVLRVTVRCEEVLDDFDGE